MNQDQHMVSWLAVLCLLIGVWLVYKNQLKSILFSTSPQFMGPSTVIPTPGNPQGIGVPQPTPAPPGQSGQFRTDQNGDLYKWINGQWVPWGTTAPGNQPGLSSYIPPFQDPLTGMVMV